MSMNMTGMDMGSSSSMNSTSASNSSMSHSGMSHSGMDMGEDACSMHMLGNWETVGTCVLTESWKIGSQAQFAGTCIGVFLIVVLIETIRRFGREWDRYIVQTELQRRAQYLAGLRAERQQQIQAQAQSGDDVSTSSQAHTAAATAAAFAPVAAAYRAPAPRFRPTLLQQAIRSLLYAIQFTGAYIVMLIAMTFNGYLILCIVLGGLFGHFVSTWDALAFDLQTIDDDEELRRGSAGEKFDARGTDEDPYLLTTGGGGSGGMGAAGIVSGRQTAVCAGAGNQQQSQLAGKAADGSYHASGACCG